MTATGLQSKVHAWNEFGDAMPFAISIKCINATAVPIMALWDEASGFEEAASMSGLRYPPHLTLAVLDNEPENASEIFKEVFAGQSPLSISFESVSYFENEYLVLWARPSHVDALLNLHASLHRHLDPGACHEHYRVGQWVPHCSLATKIPPSRRQQAMEWAQQKRLAVSVDFEVADLVRFPPVVVRRECKLRA